MTLQVQHKQQVAAAAQLQSVPAPGPVQLLRRSRTAAPAAASAAAATTQQQSPAFNVPEGFDLPLAIALAAAAFEAYLEPVGANDEFHEVTVNNTHVTYTDRCTQ